MRDFSRKTKLNPSRGITAFHYERRWRLFGSQAMSSSTGRDYRDPGNESTIRFTENAAFYTQTNIDRFPTKFSSDN